MVPAYADHVDTHTLVPGLNLVGIPVDAPFTPNAHALIQKLGDGTTIEKLQRLNQTAGVFDTTTFNSIGAPVGLNPNVVHGEGWLVFASTVSSIEIPTHLKCPSISLLPGVNVVGVPCTPLAETAHTFLTAIGDDSMVSSVQTFDTESGRFLTAAYQNGAPVGPNFPIERNHAYLVHMYQASTPNIYLDELTCPTISPKRGAIGSRVSIRGTGFVPGQSVITLNGLTAAPITITKERIDFNVPSGASNGPIIVAQLSDGNTINCGNFTINNSPVLNAIGSRIVPLGQLTRFTVSATDPENDPLTLSVSPLPLPLGATFNVNTGKFSFSPSAKQVGTYALKFSVTDGTVSDSETVTLDVPPPAQMTTLAGRVLTLGNAPLQGVRLVVGTDNPVEAFSGTDGRFFYSDLPVSGQQRLLIDGSTVPGVPVGTYASVPEQISLIAGAGNVLKTDIFLLPLDLANADPVDPTVESTVTSAPVVEDGQTFPEISLTVQANAGKVDETGQPFSGNVSITRIPSPDLGPMPLPDGLQLSLYIAIQPFGVKYDPPATLTFPNVEGFAIGVVVDIFGLNHDTGKMEKVGDGIVEADGFIHSGTLNADNSFTKHGVVTENSWHGFVPAPPDGDDDDASGDDGGNGDPCETGSETCPKTGDMSVAHNLVSYRSLGIDRSLRFIYHTKHAKPNAFVSRLWTPGNLAPSPLNMSTKLKVAGVEQGPEIFHAGPPCSGFSCPLGRFPRIIDGTAFSTGIYPVELTLSCNFPISRRDAVHNQTVQMINQIDSPFGAGWSLKGLEKIHRAQTGDLLLTDGSTEGLVYTPASKIVSGITQTGEQDYYRIIGTAGESISLRMNRGSNQPDGSSTLDPFLEIRDSRGFLLAENDDDGDTAVSGPGQNAEITGFVFPATDTYTVISRGAGGTAGSYDLLLTTATDTPLVKGRSTPTESVEPSFLFNESIDIFGQQKTHRFSASVGSRLSVEVVRQINQSDGSGSLDPRVEITDSNGVVIFTDDDGGGNTPPGPGRNAAIVSVTLPATDTYNIIVTGGGGTTGPYKATVTFGDLTGPLTVDSAPVTVEQVIVSQLGDFSRLSENSDGSFTRHMKDGTLKEYNSNGVLTSIADRNGNVEAYTHDSLGRLILITDPVGLETILTYGDDGSCQGILLSVSDPANRLTQFQHDNQCNLVSITDPGGATKEYQYDNQHLVLQQTSPRGTETTDTTDFITKYEYDFSGRFVQSTLPDDSTRRLVSNQSIGIVPPPVNCEDSTPDIGCPNNLVFTQEIADIRVTFTDAENRTTDLGSLDKLGNNAVSIDPLGRRTLIERDVNGNPTKYNDPSGHVFNFIYDAFGNLSSITDEVLSGTTSFTYDPEFSRVTTITDSSGSVGNVLYDTNGNTTDIVSPEGLSRLFTYNPRGQISTSTVFGNALSNFTYNLRGLVDQVSIGAGDNQRVSQFEYDNAGRLTVFTDAVDRTTSFKYDDANRLTKILLPGSRNILFTYDSAGNRRTVTPPGRLSHLFDFDSRDAESKYQPPQVITDPATMFNYNKELQLTNVLRPDGKQIIITYNIDGQVNTITTPSGIYQYGYQNTSGLLSNINTSDGELLTFSYAGFYPVSIQWNGTVNGSVGWTLNKNGLVKTRNINNADTINFSYDRDGALIQAGELTVQRSNVTGLIESSTLRETENSFSYNEFHEISGDSAVIDGVTDYQNNYTRDKLGRIIEKIEVFQGITTTYEYIYDLAGRLAQVKENGMAAANYTYDSNGNRTSVTDLSGVVSASIDDQDRLVSYGDFNYSYTDNGELLTKNNTVSSDRTDYLYDVQGNLTRVELPNGDIVEYVIDGLNRRIGKKVNNVVTQKFIYGGDLNPIAELNIADQIVSRFVYATRRSVPDYMVKGGIVYRIFSDHLGSPRLIVDASTGTVAQAIKYDEFGRVLSDSNPGFQPFGFAGGLYDSSTGLVRMGVRDYDASTGRWTTKDPIRFSGGDTNLYGYVLNDPVNLIDPYGLFSWGSFFGSVGNGAVDGAVIGAVGGAIAGATGGTAVIPGIGTVTGAAGLAAVGAVGGVIVGGVGGAIANIRNQFGDSDGDGIPNSEDPFPNFPTDSNNDSDGDGIPDGLDDDTPPPDGGMCTGP